MPKKFGVNYVQYRTYDEIVALLKEFETAYPTLCQYGSIGRSLEGREIPYVSLTSCETGPACDKPAFYIDANIHAGEVTGSAVAIYTIGYLLEKYGDDQLVTHLLDTRAFYIIPRVSVDGAEVYLHTPQTLRSSTRVRPEFGEEEGIIPEDINGDGEIVSMRLKDAAGEWKASAKDPRVMLRREPADFEGDFYRVYPEGRVKGTAKAPGVVKIAASKWGLDINRNFPANWSLTQSGAGPYPLSEPETRAQVDFILSHPNITGIMAYHTAGGIILRPPCSVREDAMPQKDVEIFKQISKRGEEHTGYPGVPVMPGFAGNPPTPLKGVFLDWGYEHYGVFTYTTELWDWAQKAGIKKADYGSYWGAVSEEDVIKLHEWDDKQNSGQGFENWTAFDHPDLGQVEIGGWKTKYTRQNPPLSYLEGELHGNMMFTLEHAAASPLLKVAHAEMISVGGGIYNVNVTVTNMGFLPTNISEKALQNKKAKPVEVSIEGDFEVLGGRKKVEIGHLEGYSTVRGFSFHGANPAKNSREVSWTIKASQAPVQVTVTAKSDKAGTHKVVIHPAG